MKTIVFLNLFLLGHFISLGQAKSDNRDWKRLNPKPITPLKISFTATKIELQYFLIGGFKCIYISKIPENKIGNR